MSGLADGEVVTALQIRADDNTSALSGNALVGSAPPPPAEGDLLAADDFERTVDAGWGIAGLGGPWATGSGSYTVSEGAGRMVVGAGQVRDGRLAVDAADVSVTGAVTIDRLPVGGNAFAYVLARATGANAIRGAIRISAKGAVFVQLKRSVARIESNIGPEVASGLMAVPGEPIRFRLRVVGDELQLRVWQGPTEPDTWLTTATDTVVTGAAGAGVMAYTGKAVTGGPITFSLDAFEVRRS